MLTNFSKILHVKFNESPYSRSQVRACRQVKDVHGTDDMHISVTVSLWTYLEVFVVYNMELIFLYMKLLISGLWSQRRPFHYFLLWGSHNRDIDDGMLRGLICGWCWRHYVLKKNVCTHFQVHITSHQRRTPLAFQNVCYIFFRLN